MKKNLYDMLMADNEESKEIRDLKELEFKKQFNNKLAKFLNDNNISAKQLSDMTGYTVQHCSNIKKGITSSKSLSIFCLYRICESLDITANYLWDFNDTFSDSNSIKTVKSKRQSIINKINKIDDIMILEKISAEIAFLNKYSSDVKNTNNSSEDSEIEY